MTEPWEHAARIAAGRHRPPHLDRDDALQIARLAAWQATPTDDGSNVVTIIDPAWQDNPPATGAKQS